MIDERLQRILDNTKHPYARAMLQHLFENDNFKENMIERLKHLLAEQRGKVGFDMQAGEAGVWIWDDEELDEGIFSAAANALKSAATSTIATGLGVSASGLHKFGHDLMAKPKQIKPKFTAQKPLRTKPVANPVASLTTAPIHHAVLPSDVHSKIGKFPGEHEDHGIVPLDVEIGEAALLALSR